MAAKRNPSGSKLKIKGTNLTVQIEHGHYAERDGELDWNALGSTMTKYLEDDVIKATRVDFRFGTGERKKAPKGSKADTDWEYSYIEHDIIVFKKKLSIGSPYTCWMGRGVIDVPLRKVAEFIKDVQNNMSWDDLLIEARYLKDLSQSDNPVDFLGYQRFEKATCFVSTHRDFLYFARCLYKGNKYIQAGLSVDDPDFMPPPGVKRVEARLGSGWVMEPYQGDTSKTLVTYVANTDLKGLPIFMMNHVLKRHPLALHYVRRQLTDPRAQSHVHSQSHDSCNDELEESITELSLSKHGYESRDTGRTNFEEDLSTKHFF